jgi:hypothetical protein
MSCIRWTNNPDNPQLNGTLAHVSKTEAELRVILKQAVHNKRPNFGTPEWAEERCTLDAAGAANDPHNVNPCVEGVQWGVKDASSSGFNVVTVIKKFGSETTIYSTPPTDAPKSIVKLFEDLSNSTGRSTAAADFEAAKVAQIKYNESVKHARRY